MADELRQRYDRETDIRYAAARLWVDAIIDPRETREVLIAGVRRRHPLPRYSSPSPRACFRFEGLARDFSEHSRNSEFPMAARDRPPIRIGNGAGFWGDNLDAPFLLARDGKLDVLTLEYLAELTLAILSHQRAKDAAAGFVTDFPERWAG